MSKPKENTTHSAAIVAYCKQHYGSKHLRGMEVGVWRGANAEYLLREMPSLHLALVDPWKKGEPDSNWTKSGSTMPGRPQKDYDAAYEKAKARLAPYAGRYNIYRTGSLAFLTELEENGRKVDALHEGQTSDEHKVDFVFLDGDHSYENVIEEIHLAMEVIRDGGWIGGHDYNSTRNGRVKEAVLFHFDEAIVHEGKGNTWFVRIDRSDTDQ